MERRRFAIISLFFVPPHFSCELRYIYLVEILTSIFNISCFEGIMNAAMYIWLKGLFSPCSTLSSVVELHENGDWTKLKVTLGKESVECYLKIYDSNNFWAFLCYSMHGLQQKSAGGEWILILLPYINHWQTCDDPSIKKLSLSLFFSSHHFLFWKKRVSDDWVFALILIFSCCLSAFGGKSVINMIIDDPLYKLTRWTRTDKTDVITLHILTMSWRTLLGLHDQNDGFIICFK